MFSEDERSVILLGELITVRARLTRPSRLAAGIVLVLVAGCAQGVPKADIEKTVAARGILTYQGQPLEFYQVMVLPEWRRAASGITNADGAFVLGTNGAGDGAVAGRHKATVVYVGPPPGPEKGMDDFSPPPPPKIKIPDKYARAETSDLEVEIPAQGTSDLKIDLP